MKTTIDLCNFDLDVLKEMKDALNSTWRSELVSAAGPGKTSELLVMAIAQVSAAIDIVEQREKVNSN